ncbi:Sulfate adenylyltransferase [Yamadazyma tenuis]|uniref:sulfate adenylyltransferase n=1 Tax=Candida tenuis (strain ATCC 10573 / BCRC 21748 / CBS 615 / JCM 9827 / NBRC 10315 / NRRL Y-1498 / VKM Y-70) TaxID=590646 RepID=G3B9P0_CANTC|nr:ATP sulfurylase [Yamadazyma tenuis ATCC 10573]XP_006688879.1 uncharacterized protein CANTEDRAFT_115387 [Yamadazyma tenuis ATCC 10573]EGV62708.1 ATP sulfurylase [Yamadazyma tenuis ATCC 10573]EGV62709.1 hypothetical protein CANTEDRAFT_115387 [Yamadazyma tenuis ATCC 10573]WEJ93173.1 Sulfate adenylyltransferase [Yamadazyma tenuis]
MILQPHGGVLQDLVLRDAGIKQRLINEIASEGYKKYILTDRQLCDLELILNGGFSPLTGFLNEDDYNSVVNHMRLASVKNEEGRGLLWPIPITLDVDESFAKTVKVGEKLVLTDLRDDNSLALLTIESIYKPNKQLEAEKVFRGDPEHPAVKYLFNTAGDIYIGGSIQGLSFPKHYDYVEIRTNPTELREQFQKAGWNTGNHKTVAFQTRNPMHRAHRELTIRAAKDLGEDGHILIHPVVGLTKPGDIDHHTRVKVYKQILKKFPENLANLSLLPLAMRMGGDKEALWHALIRQNYGVDHFIVGRDHAGPGKNSQGVDFYGPYDAQDLLDSVKDELPITIVPFRMVTYLPEEDRYAPIDTIDLKTTKTANISGTELRQKLRDGSEIPEWFSYPEVVQILRSTNPPRKQQGFVIIFNNGKGLKQSDYISFGFQSVLNELNSNRRITKLVDNNDPFIINELVKAGSGVLVLSSNIDEITTTVGASNSVVVNVDEKEDKENHFNLNSNERDFSEFIATVIDYLRKQDFL